MSWQHLPSHAGVLFMRLIAPLPLPWVRAMGWALGWLLYALAQSRRRIVQRNLSLCFSELSTQEIRQLTANVFIFFAQSWLDRSWLWHGSTQQLSKRLALSGEAQAIANTATPTVLFAPHFMGLDAGWTALNTQLAPARPMSTIYAAQSNPVVDAWILQGRQQHGDVRLLSRQRGVREIASSLKAGVPLYLLPDMDMGAAQSEFVPFFGVSAATVPSLPRFAKLASAQVRSVHALLTPSGYSVSISKPWEDYPSGNLHADTTRMNRELEALIRQAPAQYYWVHKRFKTRPPGEAAVY
ncbi:MAG: lipid A biosynthesis acyltransferase [Brachymonas sp.]